MHDPKIPEKAASEAPWQLYAAAPEMLAVLKRLVAVGCLGVVDDMAAYRAAWEAVPIVIAKAEGRS